MVDLGSGKGYLSHVMSSVFGFDVVAIDASAGNIKGAKKREDNLEVGQDLRTRVTVSR